MAPAMGPARPFERVMIDTVTGRQAIIGGCAHSTTIGGLMQS
jgi:hypothetical protein